MIMNPYHKIDTDIHNLCSNLNTDLHTKKDTDATCQVEYEWGYSCSYQPDVVCVSWIKLDPLYKLNDCRAEYNLGN